MKKTLQRLSTILLSALLVLSVAIGLVPEALADSSDAMPVAETVKPVYRLQSRRCASDRVRSKFTDLLDVLPDGARLDLTQLDRHGGATKTVATCDGVAACDILASACEDLGGVGQCGGDDNPTGCQCEY